MWLCCRTRWLLHCGVRAMCVARYSINASRCVDLYKHNETIRVCLYAAESIEQSAMMVFMDNHRICAYGHIAYGRL